MSSSTNSDSKPKGMNDKVSDVDIFLKDGFKFLTTGIRHSNALPTNSDWNFYKLNESFCKVMNNENDRLLKLINSILRQYDIEENIKVRKSIEDKIELIVEGNDTILEKVGDNLDELNGIKKKHVEPVEFQTVTAELPISGSWNRINKATFSVSSSINSPKQTISSTQSIHLLTGKNIIRPQTFFKDKIDNSNNYPWQPRITEKPNSIRPLALYLEETEFGEAFCHPYQTELDQFEPSLDQLQTSPPLDPKPISETPLHIIQTPEKLNDLVEDLRKHKIIGVDLEHHSYRTFMGITCLMQISTTAADYIIDTLVLRDKLSILNEIFTKSSIIKVFHGADCDIPWLQRDLSLYVVNMFDTHQAAKQLGYSGLSLAYLLQRFCRFIPNKHFQLADWRIRPLPEELINYAREDTHYLIYLYGVLRNELLKQANGKDNILRSVIHRSTEICKKRYFKPILNDDSHLDFYRKCKRLFDNRQMFALKELYQWRDKIAREEDESTGYVLPNHMLLQIAEMLPREMQGILACCNPIPPLVRSNLLELHHFILKAREQSLEKPIMKEDNRSVGSTQQFSKINIESPIYCPHDLTKQSEFRDDLTVLLSQNPLTVDEWQNKFSRKLDKSLEKNKSKFSVFNTPENSDEDADNLPIKASNLKFLGPYERYKLVKPFIEAQEMVASETTKDGEQPEDRPTDDRIASLHEHFLKVAKTCPHPKSQSETFMESEKHEVILPTDSFPSRSAKRRKLEDNSRSFESVDGLEIYKYPEIDKPGAVFSDKHFQSLSETNTKKRKYEEFCQPLSYMHGVKKKRNEVTPVSMDSNYNVKGNPLHTPVPNLNRTSEIREKKSNKRKRKMKSSQQQKQQQQQQTRYDGNNDQNSQTFKKTKGQKFKKRNRNNSKNTVENSNEQRNFAPFDYSSVDYRQFQGGASSSSTTNNGKGFHSKFKGKNKKKFAGQKFNKFSTFGNSRK